ncbi:MAG TPA: hypothetical protein VMU50_02495 [Polyangia bacterium]|nr:hypothetical protein [Polyangia bacterium]
MRGTVMLALAAIAAGCGNYSNEDLEYMSVVPERQELAANLPAAQSAVQLAAAAELYKTTHNVTETLNGALDKFLGLIETIRHYSPQSRTADSRTWGPFPPSPDNPDWRGEMQISRASAARFDYWFGFVPVASPGDLPLSIIDGNFQLGASLREGHGELDVATAKARAAGLTVNLGLLDHMEIAYDVVGPTVSVNMTITNLPNPLSPSDIRTATYQYAVVADGRGAMTFTFMADAVPGPAVETIRLTSRWLPTGEGRAEAAILDGDGAGAQQVQCWNAQLGVTYNSKPWAPLENAGTPADCADIPATL